MDSVNNKIGKKSYENPNVYFLACLATALFFLRPTAAAFLFLSTFGDFLGDFLTFEDFRIEGRRQSASFSTLVLEKKC